MSAGLSSAAAAQETAADDPADVDDGITVQGERKLERSEVISALRDIAMRGRTIDTPLSKYQEPICVQIAGLGDDVGTVVANRIQANVIDAGFTVAPSGCTTNALVVFVDDPQTFITRLRKKYPDIFTVRGNRRIKAAFRRNDPAINWALFQLRDRDGANGAQGGAAAGGSFIFGTGNANALVTNSLDPSRITIKFSDARINSFVIYDAKRISGYTTNQLADYATVWLLGNPQPEVEIEVESAQSILSMFKTVPEEAPPAMTQLDRAYLRGLYAMGPNEPSIRLERFVRLAYDELDQTDCGEACATPVAAAEQEAP
ncbi:MAG: hypothetical protein NWP98_00955 [Erythrobacter sp.]|nr:hypothetical protein [Erythrobacter sp.]